MTDQKSLRMLPREISGIKKRATRAVVSIVGVYGGLLGMEHGFFETLQGNVAPGRILINAIGPQAINVW